MLIVQDPKLLLLDEPTAGMTQAETHKTAEIIKGLRGQHTILVVEHDMAFVREIAERITVHASRPACSPRATSPRSRADPNVRRPISASAGHQQGSLMLKLTDVDSFYGRSHILHDVSLTSRWRKVTAVLGRNGTGKTTLLKTLMGLTDRIERPHRLGGRDIGAQPAFRRARAGIAYVPQGREIIPGLHDPREHPDGRFRPQRRQAG